MTGGLGVAAGRTLNAAVNTVSLRQPKVLSIRRRERNAIVIVNCHVSVRGTTRGSYPSTLHSVSLRVMVMAFPVDGSVRHFLGQGGVSTLMFNDVMDFSPDVNKES